MPYSNFRTLDDVKEKLGVTTTSTGSLFADIPAIQPSQQLSEILEENVPLALNMNSVKRSHLITHVRSFSVTELVEVTENDLT